MRVSSHFVPSHSQKTSVVTLFSAVPVALCILWSCNPCPQQDVQEPTATPAAAPLAAPATGSPLVGIVGSVVPESEGERGYYRLTRTYRDAVVRAGARSVLLLPVAVGDIGTLLDGVDALLMSGGPDIDPSLYGEEAHPSVNLVAPERQEFDLALIRAAMERRMPILGICLGSQELNVALGGSLIQDIPTEVESELVHRVGDGNGAIGEHEITLVEGTVLTSFYDEPTFVVNSNHHQASDVLGEGLEVAARASDGVVEGFYLPDYPFLVGVQYHPEAQTSPGGLHDRLFRALVEAAVEYRSGRQ